MFNARILISLTNKLSLERDYFDNPVEISWYQITLMRTTVEDDATCGGARGVRESTVVLTSLRGAGKGRGGAGDTAAAARGPAPGGVL